MKYITVLLALCTLACTAAEREPDPEAVRFKKTLDELELVLHGDLHMPARSSKELLEQQQERLHQMEAILAQFDEGTYPHSYFTCLLVGQRGIVNLMHRELHPELETDDH